MNTRTLKQAFAVIVAAMVTLPIASSSVFAQDRLDKQAEDSSGNALVGVWQSDVTQRDCTTGAAVGSLFKGLSTIMQGGTMSEDGLDPSSPYRTPGQGIWGRISGRQYITAWTYFTFSSTGTASGSVKIEEIKTLSQDANSLTGDAVIKVFNPSGTRMVFTGCSNESGNRFSF